ncbi:RNA-binding RNA processing protein rpp1 [Saxophila tyrrhenica]|uniref:RNA-binding RNA processing protein rpp1 n=1 Tax=Saxophila tyrrhenica TaxID=1690608 RepID=A0AAV9PHA3_9PEZI|nr:RNA-binding RNA processing protein rpp1 [Saxophila tyrrhenica]
MFYDLNIPWASNDLPRTLTFLDDLGYNVVALNHTVSGKLPSNLSCPIPDPLPYKDLPAKLTILRRCTLVLTETHQNARLTELSRNYDLLAVRPVDEKTLQLACSSLDCDIISLDMTQRLPFWFKFKMMSEAIKSGKRFEISYASGVMGDSGMRRNLISNATQLIRASRGRGLIISSEAKSSVACRGPWDAINLAAVWGLGQERGYEAMSKECRSVVVAAQFKRTSYRGVINVVYGGEKPAAATAEKAENAKGKGKGQVNAQKRKADAIEATEGAAANGEDVRPISKRQTKRQQKEAKLKAAAGDAAAGDADVGT